MDTIKVKADGIQFKISKENFPKGMKRLENLLKPGVPVMVKSWERGGIMGLSRNTRRHLFCSSGKLTKDKSFLLQKGSKNYAFIVDGSVENPFEDYQVIPNRCEELNACSVSLPHTYRETHVNEHSFSPAGPSIDLTLSGGGTNFVLIGDRLRRRFPDAMNALTFVSNAHELNLNQFYLPKSITTKEELKREEVDKEELKTTDTVTLSAALGLINQAGRELLSFDNSHITQISYYPSLFRSLRREYPVDRDDYFVQEFLYPKRTLGFLKVDKGPINGQVFAIPYKGAEKTFELAFSDDMVKKNFPYGFEK